MSFSLFQVHIWTDVEEKRHISLRNTLDDEFHKSKNHESLWAKIHNTMVAEGIVVSKAQVLNKWRNMKKKCREVKDANNKTGNSETTWKHENDFDDLFGHKASTQAACTFDSSEKKGDAFDSNDKVQKKPLKATNTEKKLPKKRASESLSSMSVLSRFCLVDWKICPVK